MVLDDAGANPVRIAAAIHAQLPDIDGPVDVVGIARAVGIVEIRYETLDTIEGALLTTPGRGYGSILVNRRANRPRQRFTIAHELGHYLNAWHRMTSKVGFQCSKTDMSVATTSAKNRYLRQEAEANRFAIELLAPKDKAQPFLIGEPDCRQIMDLADALEISREAAARRYIALHDAPVAVVFSKDGKMLYSDRSKDFPWITLSRDDPLSDFRCDAKAGRTTSFEEVVSSDWISSNSPKTILAQTRFQRQGYAMTLLRIDDEDRREDDEDPEDTLEYLRFRELS